MVAALDGIRGYGFELTGIAGTRCAEVGMPAAVTSAYLAKLQEPGCHLGSQRRQDFEKSRRTNPDLIELPLPCQVSSGPGSPASSQVAMPAVLSGSSRDGPQSTTSSGTRRARTRLQRRHTTSFELPSLADTSASSRLLDQNHSVYLRIMAVRGAARLEPCRESDPACDYLMTPMSSASSGGLPVMSLVRVQNFAVSLTASAAATARAWSRPLAMLATG